MRSGSVPRKVQGFHGARQHRLAERHAAQRGGVKAGKRVEGIALDIAARYRRIHETQIEKRVVSDQNGAAAVVAVQGFGVATVPVTLDPTPLEKALRASAA